MEKDTYVYLMELSNGYYYVGETKNIEKVKNLQVRSEWTKIHKPIKLFDYWKVERKLGISQKTVLTLYYMMKYGIDKVRGGGYSEIKLQPAAIRNIRNYFKYMKECKTIEELTKEYARVNEINYKIFKSTERFRLNYNIAINKYDELASNDKFLNLNMNDHLTRDKKRKVFGDIEFKPYLDNPDNKKKKIRIN